MGKSKEEYYPEKVVILTGPSLGTAVKLVLFGAVLGCAGTLYWSRKSTPGADDQTEPSRGKRLLQRATKLAAEVADLAQHALPQWQDAVTSAKTAAHQTEEELHRQLEEDAT